MPTSRERAFPREGTPSRAGLVSHCEGENPFPSPPHRVVVEASAADGRRTGLFRLSDRSSIDVAESPLGGPAGRIRVDSSQLVRIAHDEDRSSLMLVVE